MYLAEQKMGTATRKVAIKTLHPELSGDPQLVARFHRESATVIELSHPNTIQFYDFGELDDRTLFIVMEYIEGESLAHVLQRGALDPARIDKLLIQICGSLHEAHQHRHRPPRPQARERAPHRSRRADRLRQGARLRHREAERSGGRAQREAHEAGDGARHASLHEPGAVQRSGARRALRHLLARHHGVRDAHRAAPVRGQDAVGVGDQAPDRGAQAARELSAARGYPRRTRSAR